jgi:hypothetical protein
MWSRYKSLLGGGQTVVKKKVLRKQAVKLSIRDSVTESVVIVNVRLNRYIRYEVW